LLHDKANCFCPKRDYFVKKQRLHGIHIQTEQAEQSSPALESALLHAGVIRSSLASDRGKQYRSVPLPANGIQSVRLVDLWELAFGRAFCVHR
jgi:hypothetical protein